MKRDDLIDHAIHLYRSGLKITRIAQICYVNRRTIHRWIKQSGAKRNDYHKRHQEKELAIRAKAEKETTIVDKINSYRHNMLWEMLIQFLPNAEVKNVTEMIKLWTTELFLSDEFRGDLLLLNAGISDIERKLILTSTKNTTAKTTITAAACHN